MLNRHPLAVDCVRDVGQAVRDRRLRPALPLHQRAIPDCGEERRHGIVLDECPGRIGRRSVRQGTGKATFTQVFKYIYILNLKFCLHETLLYV